MSAALFDSIARIARHESESRAMAGVGVVTETHSGIGGDNDYAVNLKMRDSGLVLKQVPVASGLLGVVAMPEPGDLVVVVFMDGDYHAPVVVGRLYHPELNPPAHGGDELVMSFPAGEAEAATHLSVGRGSEASIRLTLGDEFTLEMTSDTATLTLGDMKLEITGKSGGRAELAAGDSKITMKNSGDVSISSKTKLVLEGNEIHINGQSKVVIKGGQIDIN